jgi:hypothetical protein
MKIDYEIFLKKTNISKRCKISRSHHKKYTSSGVFSGLCTKSTIWLMKPLFFGRCSVTRHGINPYYRSVSDETIIRILFGFTILPTTRSVLPGGFNPDYHPKMFLSFLPAPGRTFLPLPYRKMTFVVVVGKITNRLSGYLLQNLHGP